MFKPLSTDPKCSFSVSLPISIIKTLEQNLQGKSRSCIVKEAILFWLREKDRKSK